MLQLLLHGVHCLEKVLKESTSKGLGAGDGGQGDRAGGDVKDSWTLLFQKNCDFSRVQ